MSDVGVFSHGLAVYGARKLPRSSEASSLSSYMPLGLPSVLIGTGLTVVMILSGLVTVVGSTEGIPTLPQAHASDHTLPEQEIKQVGSFYTHSQPPCTFVSHAALFFQSSSSVGKISLHSEDVSKSLIGRVLLPSPMHTICHLSSMHVKNHSGFSLYSQLQTIIASILQKASFFQSVCSVG